MYAFIPLFYKHFVDDNTRSKLMLIIIIPISKTFIYVWIIVGGKFTKLYFIIFKRVNDDVE